MNGVNRVVVTGLGAVSPIGHSAGCVLVELDQGVCGIGTITLVPADQLLQKIVAEVKGFDPQAHFNDRQIVTLDRVSQFAVVAAREAIAAAAITFDDRLSEQTATIIGTGVGGRPPMTTTSAASTGTMHPGSFR